MISLSSFAPEEDNYVITESSSEHIRETCRLGVKSYYSYVEKLLGNNLNDSEKTKITYEVQKELFLNDETRIKDLDTFAQSNYNVPDYFNNVATLYNNLAVEIVDTGIETSNIYYNDQEKYYFLISSVKREVFVNNNIDKTSKTDSKLVDIYFRFTPKNSKILIYSIQDHKADVLKNLHPLVPVTDSVVEKKRDQNKPYFAFDIKPQRADILIDGVNIFNDGDKLVTTPGVHNIEIIAPGYHSERFDVKVSESGVQPVSLKLVKQVGYMAVNTEDKNIKGAGVYIDDEWAGNLPLKDLQLAVGSHKLVIEGSYNFRKKYMVTISDEKVTYLNIQSNSNRWKQYNPDVFISYYPSLYVAYPPVVSVGYPSGYWEKNARPYRVYEQERKSSRTYKTNARPNVSKPEPQRISRREQRRQFKEDKRKRKDEKKLAKRNNKQTRKELKQERMNDKKALKRSNSLRKSTAKHNKSIKKAKKSSSGRQKHKTKLSGRGLLNGMKKNKQILRNVKSASKKVKK